MAIVCLIIVAQIWNNTKIYFHFLSCLSHLNAEMKQVVETLSHGEQEHILQS